MAGSVRYGVGKLIKKPGPASAGLRQTIEGFGTLRLRVGFFETAKYEDGTPVAYVASIQEFGSGPIPPRPFMRPTADQHRAEWTEGFASGAKAVAEGRRTPEQVFGAIGSVAAGQIGETIASITTPPLKQATVDARRRKYAKGGGEGNLSKPLVSSGLLIASPTFEVDRQ